MLSTRKRKTYLNQHTMRPQQVAYPLDTTSVEQLEAFIYQGYAYAVCGDLKVAVLTTARADEDVVH